MNVSRFSNCASKPPHFDNVQKRSWAMGVETVEELYEYTGFYRIREQGG